MDDGSVLMSDLLPIEVPDHDNPFRIGDTAHHKYKDLDGREVVSVFMDGIRIRIGDLATAWLDAKLYDRTPNPNIATDSPHREIPSEED